MTEKWMEQRRDHEFNNSIEASIDRKGEDSVHLIERLHDPGIKKQILDLLCESERLRDGDVVCVAEEDASGNILKDDLGKSIYNEITYVSRAREEIEAAYDLDLARIETFTPISYGSDYPNANVNGREMMPLNWKMPGSDVKPTPRMMSVIEAHEKGHVMRPYEHGQLDEIFLTAFDKNAVEFTESDYQQLCKAALSQYNETPPSFDEMRENFFDYLFSAAELAERMSQLKNYYSMKGTETFTKEHLTYARSHYVQDTGMDNAMTEFFKAITSEKEKAFLELINKAGI